MSNKKRYAIVGTGARAGMYVDALAGTHQESAEIVGLCDLSQVRTGWHNRRMQEQFGLEPRSAYPAADF